MSGEGSWEVWEMVQAPPGMMGEIQEAPRDNAAFSEP